MTHPLTDDLAKKVAINALWSSDIGEVVFTHNDLRAAFDKGFEAAIECIGQAGLAHWSALADAQESFYKQQDS